MTPLSRKDFGTRDELMEKVRRVIESGLPVEFHKFCKPQRTLRFTKEIQVI